MQVIDMLLPTSGTHCVFLEAVLRALCEAAEREPMMSSPRRHTIMLGNTSQNLSQEGHRAFHNDMSGRGAGWKTKEKEKWDESHISTINTYEPMTAEIGARHAPVRQYPVE